MRCDYARRQTDAISALVSDLFEQGGKKLGARRLNGRVSRSRLELIKLGGGLHAENVFAESLWALLADQ